MVNNVQIPQIPDGANPVQPRLQDGADQESHPANHLRDNSTDQTDSIEQDEDMLVSNFSLLMSLEAPQVMEKSPIHLFSASSEVSFSYNMLTHMISLLLTLILGTMHIWLFASKGHFNYTMINPHTNDTINYSLHIIYVL